MKTATSEINSKLVNGREQYLLEHMLGAGSQYAKKKWGFRNRFVTSSYTVEGRMLLAMESRGLVLSHKLEVDGLVFTATELGCKAIGLHDAAIKRAME
jgi:hypothetical protein